jgi:hypothetical protein
VHTKFKTTVFKTTVLLLSGVTCLEFTLPLVLSSPFCDWWLAIHVYFLFVIQVVAGAYPHLELGKSKAVSIVMGGSFTLWATLECLCVI